jgi:hypothetical protein
MASFGSGSQDPQDKEVYFLLSGAYMELNYLDVINIQTLKAVLLV